MLTWAFSSAELKYIKLLNKFKIKKPRVIIVFFFLPSTGFLLIEECVLLCSLSLKYLLWGYITHLYNLYRLSFSWDNENSHTILLMTFLLINYHQNWNKHIWHALCWFLKRLVLLYSVWYHDFPQRLCIYGIEHEPWYNHSF